MCNYINRSTGIVLLMFVLALSACSSHSDNKIGILLHDLEGRWFTDIEYLKKHAADAGVELVIKIANGNENLQLEQASQITKEGIGALIVIPVNQNSAAGIVRIAHDARLKVIAYDRIISNSNLDYFITYEYQNLGTDLAKYAHQKVPKGNYVMLWGDASDNNARLMREGEEAFLKPYIENGDVKVLHKTFVENWDETNAAHALQQVIDFSDEPIDVVLASNDNIAQAAVRIFSKNNVPFPKVITGQDATIEACRSIMRDKQTMSIYKSTNQMAKEAIDLAVSIINNEHSHMSMGTFYNNRKNVATVYLEQIVVDKNNLIDEIVGDGMFTLEEIMAD